MPEIDLPTVIFALVALFVAWKLRSVLGMRQDSDRPGELAAPLRRAPGPASAPVAQPDAAPSDGCFTGPRGSLERRRRARSCGLERSRRHCRRGSQLLAARLSGRRSRRLRHGRPCFRRRRFRRPQKPHVARGLRQFRERDPRPSRRRTHNVDHGRLDRQGVDCRRSAPRHDRATSSALLRQARFRNSRHARRSRRRVARYRRRAYRPVDIRARCSLPRSQLAADGDRIRALSRFTTPTPPMPPRLESMDFESLAGWIDDDHQAAFCAFERSARAIARNPSPAGAVRGARIDCERARSALRGRHGRARRAPIFRVSISTFPRCSRERQGIPDRILRALRSSFEG